MKTTPKRSPTSKSQASKASTEQMYQIFLKSLISSLVMHVPRELLIEISAYINQIYPKIKDRCLDHVMERDTTKKRDMAWNIVENKLKEILFPLLQAINNEEKNLLHIQTIPIHEASQAKRDLEKDGHTLDHAIKAYAIAKQSAQQILAEGAKAKGSHHSAESQNEKKNNLQFYWPIPREINFLQIKDADDVATISCRVGNMTIPYAMIDSGSDSSVISENVAKHLGLKIDRKKIHRLNGVSSKSLSLGTIPNVPVTIGNEENSLTVIDEFSVIPTEYDNKGKEQSLFILGTQWQYRAGWEPLVKGEFKATRNGKTITIPLSVHKSQRNVFTIEKDPAQAQPFKKK